MGCCLYVSGCGGEESLKTELFVKVVSTVSLMYIGDVYLKNVCFRWIFSVLEDHVRNFCVETFGI